MGLDMYAYIKGTKEQIENLDLNIDTQWVSSEVSEAKGEPGKFIKLIFYWRKHNALHAWMEDHWKEEYPNECEFNCVAFELSEELLDELERDTKSSCLTPRSGFFFGDTDPEKYREWNPIETDLKFIELARQAMAAGLTVYYDSWW